MATLVERGADLDMQTLTGNTSLMNAVREEDGGSVDFMLANGCDVNVVNDDGNTALVLAAQGGRVGVCVCAPRSPSFVLVYSCPRSGLTPLRPLPLQI
jgi:hypothetical protein